MEKKAGRLYLFPPPYATLAPVPNVNHIPSGAGVSGTALIWCMGYNLREQTAQAEHRPPGVALVVVLPPAAQDPSREELLLAVGKTRPAAVLPFHAGPVPSDLQVLLRAHPDDLPGQVTDFLIWRGLPLGTEARHLFRRTLEMSRDLRSVSGLARGLHVSRRALGRRFDEYGLPVPSHCLHFGRLLHAHLLAQTGDHNLTAIAAALSYPDAFALSNQMSRMLGIRPSEARLRLGWEWLVELWLQREQQAAAKPRCATTKDRTAPSTPPRTGPGATT